MQRPAATLLLLAALAATLAAAPGCALLGVLAYQGTRDRPINVKAQWRGLDAQSVAIVVESNATVLGLHPDAPDQVRINIAQRIGENVPDVTVLPDAAVQRYLADNRGWMAYPRSRVLNDLGVDQLIVVDLFEYRMHAPGDRHVKQGNIAANINVVSADAADPDSYAFGQTVSAVWPTWNRVGTLKDESIVELKTLQIFARDAAGLFYDYQRPREE